LVEADETMAARLKVIEDFGEQELQAFVLGVLAPQTRQVSEDLPSVRHNAITLGTMAAHIALPWFGQNQIVSNSFLARMIVAAVTEVCRRRSAHS
jgi:hypothetical protein